MRMTLKLVIFWIALYGTSHGAKLTPAADGTVVRPGGTVAVQVFLADDPADPSLAVVGVQWELQSALNIKTAQISAGMAAMQKEMFCYRSDTPGDALDWKRCLIIGMNPEVPLLGQMAVFQFPIPTDAVPGTNYQIGLAGTVGTNAAANEIAVAIDPSITIKIAAREDVTLDGIVDWADVQSLAECIVGLRPCAPDDDINQNGKVNVGDLQAVIKAIRSQ